MQDFLKQGNHSSIAVTIPVFAAAFALLLGILLVTLLQWSAGDASQQNIRHMGSVLAAELASSSTKPLLQNDALSLQVETTESSNVPGVVSAQILGSDNQPLTQSNRKQPQHRTQTFSVPIFLEGKKAGTAVIELDTNHFSSPYQSLLKSTLLGWAALSLLLVFAASLLAKKWSERLIKLASNLPRPENTPETERSSTKGKARGKSEIDLLEESLTPLLHGPQIRQVPTTGPGQFQSIISLSCRNLTRLETELSEDNYNKVLDKLDQIIELVLNLYAGKRLNVHDQTVNLQFNGQTDEDDHPVRALYATQAIFQLLKQLQLDNGLNLDCAIALTTDRTCSPTRSLRTALDTERQRLRANDLLKAASVNEVLLDKATGTHSALDHIALLEPLNPEQTLFRCEGLEETAETLVSRQLAFFKKARA